MNGNSTPFTDNYRFLAEALDTFEMGTFILDSDFRVVWANLMVEKYFDLDRAKIVGMDKRTLVREHIQDIFEDPERFARKILATYDNNTYTENFEAHVLPSARRRERWVEHRSHPLESGQLAGGRIEYYYDITGRKEKEQELEISNEKFRALAENNLVGIALIQDGVFKYLNPTYARMFGYTTEELMGAPNAPLVHPDDRALVHDKMQQRLEGAAEHANYIFRGRTKQGQTRFFEVHGSRVTYQGRPAIIGTLVDVTDRRRLQRDVLRIQEEERQRIGQDLHDAVGSSLSGTTMVLRALTNKARSKAPNLADELERVTEMVRQSSVHVRRMSRGMNPVNLDQEELATALERLVENTKTDEDLALTLNTDGGDLSLLTNEMQTHLYWIAQEALTNARKYAEARQISVELTWCEGTFALTVEDDGKGFDPSAAEPEGMGLRTMRYRAELLGGTLEIESSRSEGTTVRCQLPVDQSSR